MQDFTKSDDSLLLIIETVVQEKRTRREIQSTLDSLREMAANTQKNIDRNQLLLDKCDELGIETIKPEPSPVTPVVEEKI